MIWMCTSCKFEASGKLVIDHLLSGCRIVIAPSVEEEVAVLGAGYPDGVVGVGEEVAQFLAELIDLGYEHRLQQLYRRFEAGELSLGYFANELGLSVRDLYAALEQRGLPTSNIGARPSEE